MAYDQNIRFLSPQEARDAEMRLAQQQVAELQAKYPRVYTSTSQWGPFSTPMYTSAASMLGGMVAYRPEEPVAKKPQYGQGMVRPLGWSPVLPFPGYMELRTGRRRRRR